MLPVAESCCSLVVCRVVYPGCVVDSTRGLEGETARIGLTNGMPSPGAAMSSPPSLPEEILKSAVRGEQKKVVKWLRKAPR